MTQTKTDAELELGGLRMITRRRHLDLCSMTYPETPLGVTDPDDPVERADELRLEAVFSRLLGVGDVVGREFDDFACLDNSERDFEQFTGACFPGEVCPAILFAFCKLDEIGP
jgi:hypothetical protein